MLGKLFCLIGLHGDETSIIYAPRGDSLVVQKCRRCGRRVAYHGSCTVWHNVEGGRASTMTESWFSDLWSNAKHRHGK